MNALQRRANQAIMDAVENYRLAAKFKNEARDNAAKYAMPDRAKAAYQMQMDRASGALEALHCLFPVLPAWKDTKWIH